MKYLNNKKFLKYLIEFQELNIDDITEWWIGKKIKTDRQREHFELCAERLELRLMALKKETISEKRIRIRKLECCKNNIGKCYLDIAGGLLRSPNFINYDQYRKDDMTSDATHVMLIYIDRYDCRLVNPFSYFTQVAFNAFVQNINKINKKKDIFVPLNYIESFENPGKLIIDEGVYRD